MCQVRPKEKLSAAEKGEKPEEASPVVLEQRDVSGRLRGGAEAAAGGQLAESGVGTVFGSEYPAAQTRSACKLFNSLTHGGLGSLRYWCPAKAVFLTVLDEAPQSPAEEALQTHVPISLYFLMFPNLCII